MISDNKQFCILIVDDDQVSLLSIEATIKALGHKTVVFSNPVRALEYFAKSPERVDVVISDLLMPDMNGITLASKILEIDPEIITVIVTSTDSTESILDPLSAGIFSFLKKPLTRGSLSSTLERAIEIRIAKKNITYCQEYFANVMKNRDAEARLTVGELEISYFETMNTIVTILDKHEHETARHSLNVQTLALILANKFGITDETNLKNIKFGALLHDIGKVGVSDVIIKKPGTLDSHERAIMQTHVKIGYDIVRTIPFLQEAAELVYEHHERYDGTGYPRGIRGNKICFGAKLFAIGDTFDALRSDRPYRKAVSFTEAVLEINKNSGTQFDPEVVKIFNSCSEELDKIYK